MRNIWLISAYTVREAFARKIFIAFLIVSSLALLITFLALLGINKLELAQEFQESKNLGFEMMVTQLQLIIITPLTALGLLLAIFSTAQLMPQILEKGTVDLFLSKPVSRGQLLFGRFSGGIIVVFLNVAYLVIGLWLIIAASFQYWNIHFLWAVITITFTFSALFSVIIFFNVITRSSVPGMMAAYFIFIVLSPLLAQHANIREILGGGFGADILTGIYYFVPKTSELFGNVTTSLVSGDYSLNWQPVFSTFLFIVLTLGVSLYIFEKKDF